MVAGRYLRDMELKYAECRKNNNNLYAIIK